MTESSHHEKAEPQLKNLCKTEWYICFCKIAPKINHMTEEKNGTASSEERQTTQRALSALSVKVTRRYFYHLSTSSPPTSYTKSAQRKSHDFCTVT